MNSVAKKNEQSRKEKKKQKKREKKEREGSANRSRGDYAPAAIGKSMVTSRANIRNDGRTCVVRHRELLGNISGSVGFTIQRLVVINPGLSDSFPWLAPMANQWDQYRFNRLKYQYVPRCGSSTSGTVTLAPEYDISDPPPSNSVQASAMNGAVSDSPWQNFNVFLDSKSLQPGAQVFKYTRSGPKLGNLVTFDGGKLYVVTEGMTGTDVVGQLWVDYEVCLSIPQVESESAVQPTQASLFAQLDSTTQNLTTGVTATTLFDAVGFNPLQITNNLGVFTPLPGAYLVLYSVTMITSAAAGMTCSVVLRQNGINFAESIVTSTVASALGVTLSGSWLVSVSGSDTIDLGATAVFSTGTTTISYATVQFLLV